MSNTWHTVHHLLGPLSLVSASSACSPPSPPPPPPSLPPPLPPLVLITTFSPVSSVLSSRSILSSPLLSPCFLFPLLPTILSCDILLFLRCSRRGSPVLSFGGNKASPGSRRTEFPQWVAGRVTHNKPFPSGVAVPCQLEAQCGPWVIHLQGGDEVKS